MRWEGMVRSFVKSKECTCMYEHSYLIKAEADQEHQHVDNLVSDQFPSKRHHDEHPSTHQDPVLGVAAHHHPSHHLQHRFLSSFFLWWTEKDVDKSNKNVIHRDERLWLKSSCKAFHGADLLLWHPRAEGPFSSCYWSVPSLTVVQAARRLEWTAPEEKGKPRLFNWCRLNSWKRRPCVTTGSGIFSVCLDGSIIMS